MGQVLQGGAIVRAAAADITGIVEYARQRGVQVLMETDMPGHSFAFGIGE